VYSAPLHSNGELTLIGGWNDERRQQLSNVSIRRRHSGGDLTVVAGWNAGYWQQVSSGCGCGGVAEPPGRCPLKVRSPFVQGEPAARSTSGLRARLERVLVRDESHRPRGSISSRGFLRVARRGNRRACRGR
jgi:hypothetical protein